MGILFRYQSASYDLPEGRYRHFGPLGDQAIEVRNQTLVITTLIEDQSPQSYTSRSICPSSSETPGRL